MASVNNIFLVNIEPPVKRYVKTLPSKVGGWRLDAAGKNQIGFILESSPDGFSYDAEVLEIYSEKEDRYLRQTNRVLFTEGFIKEYSGDMPNVDTTNMVSDEDVQMIASTRLPAHMRSKLREYTSVVTLQRIRQAADEMGRARSVMNIIDERLKELT